MGKMVLCSWMRGSGARSNSEFVRLIKHMVSMGDGAMVCYGKSLVLVDKWENKGK